MGLTGVRDRSAHLTTNFKLVEFRLSEIDQAWMRAYCTHLPETAAALETLHASGRISNHLHGLRGAPEGCGYCINGRHLGPVARSFFRGYRSRRVDLRQVVSLQPFKTVVENTDSTDVLSRGFSEGAASGMAHSHLIHLHHNQQIVILQIDRMSGADDLRNLLNHAIPREDVMIAKRRSNGKLLAASAGHAPKPQQCSPTLRGTAGCRWKCGASTDVATFSNPSVEARPISVMGDKRFTKRVRFPFAESSMAS